MAQPGGLTDPPAWGSPFSGDIGYNLDIMVKDEELIGRLASEILDATEVFNTGPQFEEALPTAADLARKLNLRLETVKKKLRLLKEADLIQPTSMQPKRYRFNFWTLRSMEENDPFYTLFCDPESPFYIEAANHSASH